MEPREYIYFKRTVRNLLDLDLNCYKSAQVQRRTRNYLLRSGYNNWPSYFRAMKDDPVEISKLKDYLTINVSTFFRDEKKFAHLRETVLPALLQGQPRLRVWSAGCSRGHEPYSLAILLAEATSINRRHRIMATDIDQSALEFARNGGPYSAEDLANVPHPLREQYLVMDGPDYRVVDRMRRKITFAQHNLLDDPFEDDFDLIVCRNVVIYFTPEAKAQLYRRFHDSLRPGGVLFVGGTEIITKASTMGFEAIGHSFYRRQVTIQPVRDLV